MKAPLEKDIQKLIIGWIAAQGGYAVRVNSGGFTNAKGRFFRFNSEPGCSDLLACLRGTFIAIEVKAPKASTKKAQRVLQESFAARVRRAGGIAVTVTGLDDLVRQLTDAGVI